MRCEYQDYIINEIEKTVTVVGPPANTYMDQNGAQAITFVSSGVKEMGKGIGPDGHFDYAADAAKALIQQFKKHIGTQDLCLRWRKYPSVIREECPIDLDNNEGNRNPYYGKWYATMRVFIWEK